MKKTKILVGLSLIPMAASALIGCAPAKELSETGKAVKAASAMTFDELKEASKAEWEAKPNGVFKAFGLTSVLRKVMREVASNYDWIRYTAGDKEEVEDAKEGENCFVKNDYKDQALLTAIKEAETKYVCDYVLIQDERSFATYLEDGILHNFVPSDAVETLGYSKDDTEPFRGIWFNKVFWTNTNYEALGGKPLTNVWQLAGTSADANHIDKVSFQNPTGEAINMSFLVSVMNKDNEARLKSSYESYYGKAWKSSKEFDSIGKQWVTEFIKNISIWHSSDGTAMKETQLKDKWNDPVVYFGAFSKMKDAVGKKYDVDLNGNGTIDEEIDLTVSCGGVDYHYTSEKNVNAMTTVKWDYAIEGFNGFIYSMDSQVVENAQYPYTACLFARTLAQESTYVSAIKNSSTATATGEAGNQYGYYYPGAESSTFPYAKGDWTKAQHLEKELVEDYDYLANVKGSVINEILALITA